MTTFRTRWCPGCDRDVKTKQRAEGEVYFRHDLDPTDYGRQHYGERCMNSEQPIDQPYAPDERGVYVRHNHRIERP